MQALISYSKERECRYNGGSMLSKMIFNLRGILAYIQYAIKAYLELFNFQIQKSFACWIE